MGHFEQSPWEPFIYYISIKLDGWVQSDPLQSPMIPSTPLGYNLGVLTITNHLQLSAKHLPMIPLQSISIPKNPLLTSFYSPFYPLLPPTIFYPLTSTISLWFHPKTSALIPYYQLSFFTKLLSNHAMKSRFFLRTACYIDLISLKIQIVDAYLFKNPGFKSLFGKVKLFCPVFFSFSYSP